MNIRKIVDKATELKEYDDRVNESLKAFLDTVGPGIMNFTFIEEGVVQGFLSAVEIFNLELSNDLEDYLYGGVIWVEEDGIRYDFADKEQFINYLEKCYTTKN